MPTKTRTRTAARKTPAVTAPVEPVLPDTQEGLLGAIIKLCDRFDEMMTPQRGGSLSIEHLGYGKDSPWIDLRQQSRKLVEALEDLLGDNSEVDVDDLVTSAITVEPGQIPPWSRAGTFLIWMGRTPFRCIWGGFPFPYAELAACDPRSPFPSSGGSFRGSTTIDPMHRTPEDVFRSYLLEVSRRTNWQKNKQVPTFKFEPLHRPIVEQVNAYNAENEWLRRAIAKGPVSSLPMPDHLQAIPMSLTF